MNKPKRRRGRTAEEVARLVAEFRGSGRSAPAFARQVGVATTTVYQWLKRFPTAPQQLIPVHIRPGAERLWLVRPDGWRIEFPRGLSAVELRELGQQLRQC